jgi:hypothetical protein
MLGGAVTLRADVTGSIQGVVKDRSGRRWLAQGRCRKRANQFPLGNALGSRWRIPFPGASGRPIQAGRDFDSNFGQITNARDPRIGQLSLKFVLVVWATWSEDRFALS